MFLDICYALVDNPNIFAIQGKHSSYGTLHLALVTISKRSLCITHIDSYLCNDLDGDLWFRKVQ